MELLAILQEFIQGVRAHGLNNTDHTHTHTQAFSLFSVLIRGCLNSSTTRESTIQLQNTDPPISPMATVTEAFQGHCRRLPPAANLASLSSAIAKASDVFGAWLKLGPPLTESLSCLGSAAKPLVKVWVLQPQHLRPISALRLPRGRQILHSKFRKRYRRSSPSKLRIVKSASSCPKKPLLGAPRGKSA